MLQFGHMHAFVVRGGREDAERQNGSDRIKERGASGGHLSSEELITIGIDHGETFTLSGSTDRRELFRGNVTGKSTLRA